MANENFIASARFLLQAVREVCFLQASAKPLALPEGASWEGVSYLAYQHMLSTILWEHIQSREQKPTGEWYAPFKKQYERLLFTDVTHQYALEELQEEFIKRKLKLLPVKGVYFKEVYPKRELREMSDMDILYEEGHFSQVAEAMSALGYEYEKESVAENHREFIRKPALLVEMHYSLLPESSPYASYYKDAFKRAKSDDGYAYRFSHEDEYIFFLLHAFRHDEEGGFGVRTVLDYALFTRKYALDRAYIEGQIAILEEMGGEGLRALEERFSRLSRKWFQESPELDDDGLYVLSGGVYGRMEQGWEKNLRRKGKMRYVLSRAFPPYCKMKGLYPSLKKVPFLLPFYWIARLVRLLFTKRGKAREEWKYVKNYKK